MITLEEFFNREKKPQRKKKNCGNCEKCKKAKEAKTAGFEEKHQER